MWVLFPIITVAAGFAIAYSRKGSVAKTAITSRCLELFSPGEPDIVFARISTIVGVYQVDDKDPQARVIVLSSPPTLFSWGFLYPVVIRPEGTGSAIKIGIQSRFIQMGPVVGHAHQKCKAAIEQLLSVPQARLA